MVICPKCKKSKNVVQAGKRYNLSGTKQKYRCNKCWVWFVVDDGFWKMKHKPKIISEACSCFKRGMSFREVARHLGEYRETDITHATVIRWVGKYSKILKKMG